MKKIFIALTALALITGLGCKKGYLDINTNPNQSTSADPSLVLPAALTTTVSQWYPGPTFMSGWVSYWAVSGSYAISSTAFYTYKMTADFPDDNGLWGPVYDNLEDYQYIDTKAAENGQDFLQGIGKIMKAYQYHHLVDMFNDVPYSDALKGALSLRPVYDKGTNIYDSLFTQLEAGITLIKNSATSPDAKSDLMFRGDKTLWIKFANTVRLRMLLRMSELAAKPGFFQPNLDLTTNEAAGFLDEDALVQPGYSNSTGKGNPFWRSYYNLVGQEQSSYGDFWRASDYGVNFYESNNDPRLSRTYASVGYDTDPTTATYVGTRLGATNGNPVGNSSSGFGPGVLRGADASSVMMLSAESYFLQAEAVVLGYIPGDAQLLYQKGVEESFRYLFSNYDPNPSSVGYDPLTPAGFDDMAAAVAYYSQAGNTNTNYTTATTDLEKRTIIIRQKWAALNSINSFEGWTDYRRFDYLHIGTAPYPGPLGDLILTASPDFDVLKIPIRLKYPTSEFEKNSDNVQAEGLTTRDYHQTSKIWWMQ